MILFGTNEILWMYKLLEMALGMSVQHDERTVLHG